MAGGRGIAGLDFARRCPTCSSNPVSAEAAPQRDVAPSACPPRRTAAPATTCDARSRASSASSAASLPRPSRAGGSTGTSAPSVGPRVLSPRRARAHSRRARPAAARRPGRARAPGRRRGGKPRPARVDDRRARAPSLAADLERGHRRARLPALARPAALGNPRDAARLVAGPALLGLSISRGAPAPAQRSPLSS